MNQYESQENISRYIVGIDLGTTNSAVAFCDTSGYSSRIGDFQVMQIVAPGETEKRTLFPSFHYEAGVEELAKAALHLPWSEQPSPRHVVGVFARTHGAQVPGRLVTSAKSWLSHAGVDRTAPLLPWHAAPDVEKISPVDATGAYLRHIRMAWNHEHPEYPLEKQDVIITVPASFDEIARELTVQAAAQAGLPRVILLEEPQAAFYSWISTNSDTWQQNVGPGQKILICDIGGGTTDFTLIEVRSHNEQVQFHRIAVGEHLILGGDNLDLAFAYHIEKKIAGTNRLSPRQFSVLVNNCRHAKEVLLGDNAPEKMVITIPGSGAALIGKSLQVEVTKAEAEEILLDGFFPETALADRPLERKSGFQEFGLPYAPDPAVTRYLAYFLTSHRHTAQTQSGSGAADPARPDIVLFNGGVLSSVAIRQRILHIVAEWFSETTGQQWEPRVFRNNRPELAVARGAAYYGLVRRGIGVRIAAGLARSYYMGIETGERMQAFCLAPAGLQEGANVDLSGRTFDLLIRQPVEFPLFVSSIRTTDQPGALVDIDPKEMHSLPPIRTVLRSGKKMEAATVPVTIHVRLTEIGTLDLWCSEKDGNRSWKLQFDVRAATRTDIAAHKGIGERAGVIDNETVTECRTGIVATFRPDAPDKANPHEIMKRLERQTDMERNQWPPSLLRSFWEVVFDEKEGRKIDPVHEARWFNLLGFALRPGYGYAVDDWRVKQTWHLFQQGVVHSRNQACRSEWWILWRRIAGGLSLGQQKALVQPLLPIVLAKGSKKDTSKRGSKSKDARIGSHEMAEIWRLVAALEQLPATMKTELGDKAIGQIGKKDQTTDAKLWAIGRLGARIPLYGPLNELVDTPTVQRWAQSLIALDEPRTTLFFALVQLCRKTGDRFRDIDEEVRQEIAGYMKANKCTRHYVELVEIGGGLDEEEQALQFGERLPGGLKLV